jgi:hypothetical protein
MTKFEVQNRIFGEDKYPAILYKYRDWDTEYHNRYILEKEVFLASPNSFEDEKDCKIPIRYDLLNEKQIIDFYIKHSKENNPNFSRQQHRKEARIWSKEKKFKNESYLEKYRKKYNTEYNKREGILCLTDKPCLEEMWKKYSNNSQGFCVGYNSKILFNELGGGGQVKYYDELPIIFPEPIMSRHEINYYSIFSKETKWDFEKEYRTHSFFENPATIENRQIKLPKEAFNRIILGRNISEKNRTQIINSVREHIGNILIIEEMNVC